MKTYVIPLVLIASSLLLSSCRISATGNGYGDDGRWHRGRDRGHEDNDRGHGRGRHHLPQNEVSLNRESQNLAFDYGLRYDSAIVIVNLAHGMNSGPTMAKLNLKSDDVSRIANLQMPSKDGIRKIVNHLNESESAVSDVVEDFIYDMQTE
jgi:predicted small secreted protein